MNNRDIIEAFRNAYQEKRTVQDIATNISKYTDETGTYDSSISRKFLKEIGKEVIHRGKPAIGRRLIKKRAMTYIFEDYNLVLKDRERKLNTLTKKQSDKTNFQIAPGYVKYDPNFLAMYDN